MARKISTRAATIQKALKCLIREANSPSVLNNLLNTSECGIKYMSLYEDYKEYIHKQANKKKR